MNLEKELVSLSYSIYFNDDLFESKYDNDGGRIKTPPYSLRIGDLLIRCCTEIEALIQALSEEKEDKIRELSYFDSKKEITAGIRLQYLNSIWKLDKKVVSVSCTNMFFMQGSNKLFAPFAYCKDDENDYYSAYNAIKHNRNEKTIYKGNIRFLLRAMAALYLLNVYYKDEIFELGTLAAPKNFDLALQSDLFAVKYELLTRIPYLGDELNSLDDVTYIGTYEQASYERLVKKHNEFDQKISRLMVELMSNPEKYKDVLSGISLSVIQNTDDLLKLLAEISKEKYFQILAPYGSELGKSERVAVLNKDQNLVNNLPIIK